MSGAGEALAAAAAAALRKIAGLGVFEAPPVQAAEPWALAEAGPETDWGHKSGTGRELRLAVRLHDKGESGARLAALVGDAEASVAAIGGVAGWQLVSLHLLRSMKLPPKRGAPDGAWAGLIEFRARLLADQGGVVPLSL